MEGVELADRDAERGVGGGAHGAGGGGDDAMGAGGGIGLGLPDTGAELREIAKRCWDSDTERCRDMPGGCSGRCDPRRGVVGDQGWVTVTQ